MFILIIIFPFWTELVEMNYYHFELNYSHFELEKV